MDTATKEILLRVSEGEVRERSDLELLATVIGDEIKAKSLLEHFQSIAGIARSTPSQLAKKIGKAKAAALWAGIELGRRSLILEDRPRLRYATEVNDFFQPKLGSLTTEEFWVAVLNVRNILIRATMIAKGGFASCAILPREVFAPALRDGGVGIILVHNHPSGVTDPSDDDKQMTTRLVQAGMVLGVRVLDHVIVGSGKYTSFQEKGLINYGSS